GANHAVFGLGGRIQVQIFTGPPGEGVGEAVFRATLPIYVTRVVRVGVSEDVNAQITTQLDAGVGARNVVESGTVQGANPHVLDRFGLQRKISSLCPSRGEHYRRGAEDKALNHLHAKPPSCSVSGKVPVRWVKYPKVGSLVPNSTWLKTRLFKCLDGF